jgi:hypothetical protein
MFLGASYINGVREQSNQPKPFALTQDPAYSSLHDGLPLGTYVPNGVKNTPFLR